MSESSAFVDNFGPVIINVVDVAFTGNEQKFLLMDAFFCSGQFAFKPSAAAFKPANVPFSVTIDAVQPKHVGELHSRHADQC